MNNTSTSRIINYSEAREEADRLSRTQHRRVEPALVACACDYSPACYACAGEGSYHDLVYSFCKHSVGDGEQIECDANDCARKEREASMVERVDTFPRVGAPLVSCRDKAIEESEANAA